LRFFFRNKKSESDLKLISFLVKKLGYRPKNLELFHKALTHKSYSNLRDDIQSNERLEYLGDTVIDLIVAHFLFEKFPDRDEGYLTKLKSKIVNRNMLSQIGAELELAEHIKYRTGRSIRVATIEGNAFEALIGAIYLDSDYETTKKIFNNYIIRNYVDLNQVLEQDLDRLMARTRSRPLPSGMVTSTAAGVMAGIALVAGLLLLAPGGLLPVFLGGATLAWYLGVYTPLKRRTPFALLAGGLCGAMGPVIGWCSAGGAATDYRVILLAGLLYLWQVPHFWLFQQRHQEEYRGAGIPILVPRASGTSPTPLCRLWIIALLAGSLLPPVYGLIGTGLLAWYGMALLALGGLALVGPERIRFASLNLLPLLLPLVLFVQGW